MPLTSSTALQVTAFVQNKLKPLIIFPATLFMFPKLIKSKVLENFVGISSYITV